MKTDEQLAEEYKRTGSDRAFNEIYRRYKTTVHKIVGRGSVNDGDDRVQDVFLNVIRHIGQYDSSRPFANWISIIAKHHRVNAVTYRARRPSPRACESSELRSAGYGNDSVMQLAHVLCLATHEDFLTPVQLSGLAETSRYLHDLVERLPPKDRRVMKAIYFEGRTFSEAAAHLKMPRGSVTTVVNRSLALLRFEIKDYDALVDSSVPISGVTLCRHSNHVA